MEILDPNALRRIAARRRRLWTTAIVGNLLVALVLLGGPWLRGRARATESRAAFVALAACLWDATPAPNPGLTFPTGDLGPYADASATEGWPMRCESRLDSIVRPPVFWMFPDAKRAEEDVRRAVDVVRRELRQVDGPRDVVPARPRLAMLRLSAGLAVLAREAGSDEGLTRPTFVLGDARAALPERVPLDVEESATLTVEVREGEVDFLALGRRAISHVRVGRGRLTPQTIRRPQLVQHVRLVDGDAWLAWWMPRARCGDECFQRALGVATLPLRAVVAPEPRWLRAHPLEDASSLRWTDDALWVIAERREDPELVRFPLLPAEDAEDPEAGERVARLQGAAHAVFQDDAAVWVADGSLWRSKPSGRDAVRATRGESALEKEVTLGSGIAETAEGTCEVGTHVRVVGDNESGALVYAREGELWTRPLRDGVCGEERRVAQDVSAWDAAWHRGPIVAWSSPDGAVSVDDGSRTRPGPCLDTDPVTHEASGLCGSPQLAVGGGRVLLITREGTDARVVERVGDRWRPLRGLRR
ncbi:MAG: hypothetical protein AAGE52_33295 [Myxococcota bacterium]